MRTICLKSRRRFATLSVDGKRADVLDLFATRSLLKYIVRVYLIGNISSASILPVIYRLLVPFVRGRGRGKKSVFVVRGRAKFFPSVKITLVLARIKRFKKRKKLTILVN